MQFTKIISFFILIFCVVFLDLPEKCEEAMELAPKKWTKSYECTDKLLGHGNFGRVFLVSEFLINLVDIHNYRALKIQKIHRSYKLNDVIKMKEALKTFKNTNLISLIDYEINGEYLIEIMEYADRGTLQSIISKYKKRETILDKRKTLNIFRQMLEGVQFLHSKGYIHGDLKPANILFNKEGYLKIADFDFMADKDKMRQIAGTPNYLEPMLLKSKNNEGMYDEFVDVYAMGKILADISQGGRDLFRSRTTKEMITLMFKKNKYELNKDTDIEIAFLINRCLQLYKNDRLGVDDLLKYTNHFLQNFEQGTFIQKRVFSNVEQMDCPTKGLILELPVKNVPLVEILPVLTTHTIIKLNEEDKLAITKLNRALFDANPRDFRNYWQIRKMEAQIFI